MTFATWLQLIKTIVIRQQNAMQPLSHSPPRVGWGIELEEKKSKIHGLK